MFIAGFHLRYTTKQQSEAKVLFIHLMVHGAAFQANLVLTRKERSHNLAMESDQVSMTVPADKFIDDPNHVPFSPTICAQHISAAISQNRTWIDNIWQSQSTSFRLTSGVCALDSVRQAQVIDGDFQLEIYHVEAISCPISIDCLASFDFAQFCEGHHRSNSLHVNREISCFQ